MSDEERRPDGLVKFAGDETVAISNSLVRRGLSLLDVRKPTEDAAELPTEEPGRVEALTDWLTGLPNIRFLYMHLTRELPRVERLKGELSLLFINVDEFSEINGIFGRHEGDRVLCHIAQVLRAAIRPFDVCVRYSGDEFIMVLSGCGADEAEAKRQELQQTLDGVYVDDPAPGGFALQLGISVGTAVWPHDGDSYEALFAVASARMDQNKAERRKWRTHRSQVDPHREERSRWRTLRRAQRERA